MFWFRSQPIVLSHILSMEYEKAPREWKLLVFSFYLKHPGNEKEMRIYTTSINLSVSVTICVHTSQNINVPHLPTTLSRREWFVCQRMLPKNPLILSP